MVQMSAADQAVVKAIPGNKKCADCQRDNPQWASVSFGTVFCLECSGVHRSLGVHISFVRSIAMDSWTQDQLSIMKKGGNAACAEYLSAKGVSASTPIKAKYESDAAQLYKEVLKARAKGLPEPTTLPPKKAPSSGGYNGIGGRTSYSSSSQPGPRLPASAPNSGGYHGLGGVAASSASAPKGGEDPNGMERLTGESEADYVARQTRLRDEARARMAAKFGSGGMGGGGGGGFGSGRMGGVGSDPSYDPNTGYGGGLSGAVAGIDLDGVRSSLASGVGSAWSALEGYGRQASSRATAAMNDPALKEKVRTSGASDLWGSLASAAGAVTSAAAAAASKIAEPDDEEGDGLAALQARMRQEKETRGTAGGGGATGSSGRYSGFGSEDLMNGRTKMGAMKLTDDEHTNWDGDFDSFANSDAGNANNVTSSMTGAVAAPTNAVPAATMNGAAQQQQPATVSNNPSSEKGSSNNLNNLGATKMKLDNTGDDFFSSFGA